MAGPVELLFAQAPLTSSPVTLVFGDTGATTPSTQIVSPPSLAPGAFGTLSATTYLQRVLNATVQTTTLFGLPQLSPVKLSPTGISGPVFGTASVFLYHRTIRMEGIGAGFVNTPMVYNKRQVISPTGVKPGIVGLPVRQGFARTVYPFFGRNSPEPSPGQNIDPSRFGEPEVSLYDRKLEISGIAPRGFGTTRVELFNRTLLMSGIEPEGFGVHVVRPPIGFDAGFNAGAFGTPFVDFRVRTLRPDSSLLDTQWGVRFGTGLFPMRVYLASRRIAPAWADAEQFGEARVSTHLNSISPAGLVGEIGTPRVTSPTTLVPVGFDSAVFGTPKRPVQNLIEPYFETTTTFGRAGTNFGAGFYSISPGSMGTPRVRSGINLVGIVGAFGETAVIGESNCGSTLAVRATMGNTSNFGLPGVTR